MRLYGITLSPEIDIIYNKALKMYDLAIACNVGRNPSLLTRNRRYNLSEFSKLYQVAQQWAYLSEAEKAAWYTAADITGANGYALFTQDKIYRIQNGLAGNATPSIYHQYKIGHIKINSPDNVLLLEFDKISPYFHPATLKVSYRSNLSASGGTPSCNFNFLSKIFFSGGSPIYTDSIPINLIQNWNTQTITIPIRSGNIVNWKLQISLNNVIGDLYFDNIEVQYLATVQNNDSICDEFPKYWLRKTVGVNTLVESIYCPDAVS